MIAVTLLQEDDAELIPWVKQTKQRCMHQIQNNREKRISYEIKN